MAKIDKELSETPESEKQKHDTLAGNENQP